MRFFSLLLLLFAASLPAQAPALTGLNLQVQWVNAPSDQTHWADNNNCNCTLTVVRVLSGTPNTTIYTGSTDPGGNLNVNLALDNVSVYVVTLYSVEYQMNIYTTPFTTSLFASLPPKQIQLQFRLTRPQINGVDQAAPVPPGATPPLLASGTEVQIRF